MKQFDSTKWKKILSGEKGHIPNKNEAKRLRQIMSATGMSEDEIRSIKSYRKELSDAAKRGSATKSENKRTRYFKSLVKRACQETALAKEHPLTIEALDKILEKEKGAHFVNPFLTESTRASHVLKLVKDK